VQTSHGAPALMDAIRALLRAALAAPHNQQFLLLSESEVRRRGPGGTPEPFMHFRSPGCTASMQHLKRTVAQHAPLHFGHLFGAVQSAVATVDRIGFISVSQL
jgi:hypothetical protein